MRSLWFVKLVSEPSQSVTQLFSGMLTGFSASDLSFSGIEIYCICSFFYFYFLRKSALVLSRAGFERQNDLPESLVPESKSGRERGRGSGKPRETALT